MAMSSPTATRRGWASLRHDLPAAVVVFLIALALCLGMAVIRTAWARGPGPYLHGWVYGLGDGVLRERVMAQRPAAGA